MIKIKHIIWLEIIMVAVIIYILTSCTVPLIKGVSQLVWDECTGSSEYCFSEEAETCCREPKIQCDGVWEWNSPNTTGQYDCVEIK